MLKSSIWVPSLLLIALLGALVVVQYALPQGPWVYAYYPDASQNALVAASQHEVAIANIDMRNNAVTLYTNDEVTRSALRQEGAILLDPKGVPLCLSSQ